MKIREGAPLFISQRNEDPSQVLEAKRSRVQILSLRGAGRDAEEPLTSSPARGSSLVCGGLRSRGFGQQMVRAVRESKPRMRARMVGHMGVALPG
ncbi:hypothetical protein ASD42_24455 [Nocardia sp. Root136]|nr:hypothetical protein ASD42_24455 [Nocardia sp. Root136]